jgi:hypothetical protein
MDITFPSLQKVMLDIAAQAECLFGQGPFHSCDYELSLSLRCLLRYLILVCTTSQAPHSPVICNIQVEARRSVHGWSKMKERHNNGG